MSNLPTFEEALQGMQGMMEKLPEMAPPTDMPPEERVRRATDVFMGSVGARFATYMESCIHCGHCAQACHYYRTTPDPKYTPIHKLELFRRTYRREAGPFRWLYKLFTKPVTADELEQWQELVFDSCSMCGRCSMICPMGIDIATMVHHARGALDAAGLTPPEIRAIAAEQAGQDTVFGASADKLQEVVGMLKEEEGIDIPLDRDKADILVLTSGLDIMMNPRGILATAKVLNHLGVDWTLRSDGFESINFGAQTGNEEVHADIARRRIDTAVKVGASTVLLCECGHTYTALRWAEFLQDEPLPFKVMYISEFLGREVQEGRLELTADGGTVTFHDPCKTGRVGGVFEEPRAVLEAMGDEVREPSTHHQANYCCGGGGAVFLLQRAASLRAGVYRLKMDQFERTGADALVTACGSCRLNFVGAAQMYGWNKPVESLVERAAAHLPAGEGDGHEPWRRPGK